MKAAVFRAPGQPLAIEQVPDPAPGPGQLVLRVRGCGICGSDLHMSEQPLPPGTVMGHEFAGDVVAVGADAGGWREGERLCALPVLGCGQCLRCLSGDSVFCEQARGTGLGPVPGAYAEYVVVDAAESFALPENLETHEGALVEPLAVGLHVVHVAGVRAGDDVLILGAGPVGLATALWARHAGAREVVVSDPVGQRREKVAGFGASAVIDPASEEVAASFERAAGRPPAVVIEAVGVPGMVQEAVSLADFRGRVVVAGVCIKPDTFVPVTALLKELEMRFVAYYNRRDFGHAIDMLRSERIDPRGMITDRIGLDALPSAFEALRKPSTQCKVIIEP